MRFHTELRLLFTALIAGLAFLSGCKAPPPEVVTLTLKKDGSHFSGTVVRREANSITLTGVGGDTHTWLLTEISKIAPGSAAGEAISSVQPQANPQTRTDVVVPADGVMQFPAGTEFPIRADGFIDSCCAPVNSTVIGLMDRDVKNAKGQVVIPENATFTMIPADAKMVDGRLTMTFALASASFGGRHYLITAVAGPSESGVIATFSGAKAGTIDASKRGLNIHIEDQSLMNFKAVNPVVFKATQ